MADDETGRLVGRENDCPQAPGCAAGSIESPRYRNSTATHTGCLDMQSSRILSGLSTVLAVGM